MVMAAIDGEILFSSDRHKLPEELELDDIDIKLEPKGRDPFGQLLSGILTVTGALKQLDFSWPLYRSNKLLRDIWGAYCSEIYLDEARELDGLVYGMLIRDEEHIMEPGDPVRLKQYLLLLQSTGKHMEFRRIGMATVACSDPGSNGWKIPKAGIVII
jgi:hypothetical protein